MISGNMKYANEILDDVECYKMVIDRRIKIFPKGFWTKPWSLESAAVITRYLLEERLKYTEEDIKTKLVVSTFIDNRLSSLITVFNSSVYSIVNNAYPHRFKPWELKSVQKGFWDNTDNIIEAVKWLVETKLGNNRERVCTEFNQDLLIECKMGSLRKYKIPVLLNLAYPNEFKPWELSAVPPGFWDRENNIKQAVRWLVETKLDNNRDRVCQEFNQDLFIKNRMSSLTIYGAYRLINIAYPNEFKPWELSQVTDGYWTNKNNIKQAVKWLVETKLDNNKERV